MRISFLLTLYLIVATNVAATEVVIRDRATFQSSIIRLGDVAEVQDADEQTKARLAAIPLMPAPMPGANQVVGARQIQDFLAALGEDMRELRFSGSPQVQLQLAQDQVARPQRPTGQWQQSAGRLTAERCRELERDLNEKITEYIAATTGENGCWDVELTAPQRLVERMATSDATPEITGGDAPWIGRQRLVVSLDSRLGRIETPLYVKVSRAESAIVARRPIPRGETITAADLDVKEITRQGAVGTKPIPVSQLGELFGMEAASPIRAGDVLTIDAVRAPLLVKRGEVVAAVARGGGIRVRTDAKARQDGALGDLIEVESVSTKQRFDAQVTGYREVSVTR